MAVDLSGNVYVAEFYNRIQKFDSDGTFITAWGSEGSGDGEFNHPWGLIVDSFGNVYVADYYNHRIQKFDPNGEFLTKWGTWGSGDGQFDYPRGVAVNSVGNIYVANVKNHRIQKFGYTAEQMIENLIMTINSMDISQGIRNSTISKLENALKSLEKGNDGAVVNKLKAFINEVEAQSGKKIEAEDAETLIEKALAIIDTIIDSPPGDPGGGGGGVV